MGKSRGSFRGIAATVATIAIVSIIGMPGWIRPGTGKDTVMAKDTVLRAVPVGAALKPIFIAVLGEDYRTRASYSVDMPKGLLRDDHIVYPPGVRQTISVVGDLPAETIEALRRAIFDRLSAKLKPNVRYAPLILNFYRRMETTFDPETGISAYTKRDLLKEFELGQSDP